MTAEAHAQAKLVTIPFSHYCEKARWALDRAGVAYVEDGHLPMLHWHASFRAGGGRTVPVLVTSDAGVLADSTDIVRYVNDRASLRLDDVDVASLEDRFDVELGPHTRRLAYFHMLPHRHLLKRVVSLGVPSWETSVVRATWPIAAGAMRKGMRIDVAGARASRARIDEVFRDVEALLSDGRRYLAGDSFSAADLTFASLSTPVLLPPQFSFGFSTEELPPDFRASRDELRATKAGAHAMRMYEEHRR